jgi:hypothetical protein
VESAMQIWNEIQDNITCIFLNFIQKERDRESSALLTIQYTWMFPCWGEKSSFALHTEKHHPHQSKE